MCPGAGFRARLTWRSHRVTTWVDIMFRLSEWLLNGTFFLLVLYCFHRWCARLFRQKNIWNPPSFSELWAHTSIHYFNSLSFWWKALHWARTVAKGGRTVNCQKRLPALEAKSSSENICSSETKTWFNCSNSNRLLRIRPWSRDLLWGLPLEHQDSPEFAMQARWKLVSGQLSYCIRMYPSGCENPWITLR